MFWAFKLSFLVDFGLFMDWRLFGLLFEKLGDFFQTFCGLYYKHTTIVNYASSIVNKLEALLTDNAGVVIYNRHVFIVQATGHHGKS
jgi:hypothetical protein